MEDLIHVAQPRPDTKSGVQRSSEQVLKMVLWVKKREKRRKLKTYGREGEFITTFLEREKSNSYLGQA